MKKVHTGWNITLLILVFAFCFVNSGQIGEIATADAAKGKKRLTKVSVRPGGHLFVSNRAFPTSAEDLKGFIKIGRKHNKKRFRWSKDSDLTLKILLVLKRAFRTSGINFVLYQQGKKEHIASQFEQIPKGKVQLHVSTLNFNGAALTNGKKYELRVTVVRKRGRTFFVTILARTYFRL